MIKRKPKTLRESCNATITKVLNTSGVEVRLPDDPIRWNFSRRFSVRYLG